MNSLLASTTATQHAAETRTAELAEVGEGIPDWPPLLIFFLLCWVTVAWTVALVLYLATFPEKVAWLDRMLARLTGREGRHEERYVRDLNDSRCFTNAGYADMVPPLETVVQQPSLVDLISLSIPHQIRRVFAGHAPSTLTPLVRATLDQYTVTSLLPHRCLRTEVSKCSRRVQARQRATQSASTSRKTSRAGNAKGTNAGVKVNSSQKLVVSLESLRASML